MLHVVKMLPTPSSGRIHWTHHNGSGVSVTINGSGSKTNADHRETDHGSNSMVVNETCSGSQTQDGADGLSINAILQLIKALTKWIQFRRADSETPLWKRRPLEDSEFNASSSSDEEERGWSRDDIVVDLNTTARQLDGTKTLPL